jgi:hypothetical protein
MPFAVYVQGCITERERKNPIELAEIALEIAAARQWMESASLCARQ